MRRPVLGYIGDLHCDSLTGLALPEYVTTPQQRWLYKTYQNTLDKVFEKIKGCDFGLRCGGDNTDLPNQLSWHTAKELLKPLVERANGNVLGVPGTEYHVGRDGQDDRTLYRTIHARCQQTFKRKESGRNVWWAHHLVKIGRHAQNELKPLAKLAEDTYWGCVVNDKPAPDLMIGHHVHRTPKTGAIVWRGIMVTTVGCWKLPDAYSAHSEPASLPDVGMVLYWPNEHKVEYFNTPIPNHLAYR